MAARYLVVANRTLAHEDVLARIQGCLTRGRCRVHILVPASPPREGLTWTEGGARAAALKRLEHALAWFRERGLEVDGEVSDADPLHAIGDTLRREAFDEIILSTLPPGLSRWLRQDLPRRVRRTFGLPVQHVLSGDTTPAAA